MELDELAKHASSFIVTKTRPDGESFITIKKRRPTWLMDMAKTVHDSGRWLPDDYKYEYMDQALDLLADGVDPEDPQLEADVYTSDLYKWLTSHMERASYVDEAVKELGHSNQGVVGDIMMGQVREKEEVFRLVVEVLNERLKEIELGVDETLEDIGPKRSPLDWSPGGSKEE